MGLVHFYRLKTTDVELCVWMLAMCNVPLLIVEDFDIQAESYL